MDNSSRTICVSLDEEDYKQLEKLKSKFKLANDNETIHKCINFTNANIDKEILSWEQVMDMINDFLKTAYIVHLKSKKDLNILDNMLEAIKLTNEEYYLVEVKEIASLLNEDEPKTVGELLRFRHRTTPIAFLSFMGVSEEEYEHLTDNGLVELMIRKFRNEVFCENAKRLFNIQWNL